MSGNNESFATNWTSSQAYTLAAVCLLLGTLGGWLIRGPQSVSAGSGTQQVSAPTSIPAAGSQSQPTAEQMKKMADTQAAALLEKLKADPNNPELLASVGNIYYDTQQYPTAIDYYQHALQAQPANAGVRTDMATAYWYLGNADTALVEFNKALTYQPNNANTLFNLGIVKWQGKMDAKGALAAWQTLLDKNPNYEGKAQVQQLMEQARKHSDLKPGTTAKPLTQ